MIAEALAAALLAWPVWFPSVEYGPDAALHAEPSWTDAVRIDGARPESGTPLAAAADAVGAWAADSASADLLFLVGRTARGVWAVEANRLDDGSIAARLSLGGASGRRRTWVLLERAAPAAAARRIAEAVAPLARSLGWTEAPLEPVDPAPLGDPPGLAYLPGGRGASTGWTLVARPEGGRSVPLAHGGARHAAPGRTWEAAAWSARAFVAAGDWVWVVLKTRDGGRIVGRWESVFVPQHLGR